MTKAQARPLSESGVSGPQDDQLVCDPEIVTLVSAGRFAGGGFEWDRQAPEYLFARDLNIKGNAGR
jgi:hypothetical protein